MILDLINKTGDIKKISKSDYDKLAQEIRDFLLEKTSKTGGHLAANLGVVELTMALHIALNLPKDKIVFDVGHQCYTHKILTGRKDGFDSLRQFDGMSGFPKRHESESDAFDTGHSSTSISAALGLCVGRDLKKEKSTVVAVIGDGALSGGMAYEALNNAAERKTNLIVILNDNNLSISPSVGGVSRSLSRIRTSVKYNEIKSNISSGINSIPMVGNSLYNTISATKKTIKQAALHSGMLFEEMGLTYLGPYDGHNILQMIDAIKLAKKVKGPVLVHVITKKGKGYKPAEKNPGLFHGIGTFDIESGELINTSATEDYTSVFSEKLVNMAGEDSRVVGITAAMADGTGLKKLSQTYPDRFFDVGIAEEHAVTFAAGLAVAGMKPVVAIYSSFLQRAYDQIIHDVALQDLPVTLCVDRSGITGQDGETHHGIFDLTYLSTIPGMTVLAPMNKNELIKALDFARDFDHPLAIRYPKGSVYEGFADIDTPIVLGKAQKLCSGKDILILAVGSMVKTADETMRILKDKGISCTLINMRFTNPLDYELILEEAGKHKLVVTMEENIISGGIGEHIAAFLEKSSVYVHIINLGIPDIYVNQGSVKQLHEQLHLDAPSVADTIIEELS